MRHTGDCNLLNTRILESSLQQSIPCGGGHASEMPLVAHQSVSECRVRILRPISHSLPLALHACMHLNVIGGINDQSCVAWAGGVFLEHVDVFLQLFSSSNVWSRSARAPRA